ncbi:MAG: pantoate--beta-alanine ligase [Candidatus Omnitrophica bacterium]|nr:pantoate--beta-alanine ligase [Candidatus Omnitrophota bacterium]
MKTLKTNQGIRSESARLRNAGKRIGLVPTMGAIHQGHLSLVRRARRECECVVASVFVNPAQFGPGEDYRTYPRNMRRDAALLRQEGVDLLFTPSVPSMYPSGYSTFVEETALSRNLCGWHRPGHFRGVCTIVSKLFQLVGPERAYFGKKDYQQALIIRRMCRDLNFPVRIVLVPIVREPDGLALSSRNRFLSPRQRNQAVCLHRALELALRQIRRGERNAQKVIKGMEKLIREYSLARPEYICVCSAHTLEPLTVIRGRILVALAVRIGKTRLIDNKEYHVRKK